jgi:hypothetical protein
MTKSEARTALQILRNHGCEGAIESAEGHFYVVATDSADDSATLWTRAELATWLGY